MDPNWDLAQEALARIGLRWSRFAREGNPAGYVRTTMVRLKIDRLRLLRRETPVEQIPDYLQTDSDADPVEPWLVAALARLTPRQRTAVVLRFVLHGTGVRQNASQPVPWENGYLLIDGEPYRWTDPNSWI